MLKRVLVYCVLLLVVLSAGLFAANTTTERMTSFSYYLTDNLPYYDVSLAVWFSNNSNGLSDDSNAEVNETGRPSYYFVVTSGKAGTYKVELSFGDFKHDVTKDVFSDFDVNIKTVPDYNPVDLLTSDEGKKSFSITLAEGDMAAGRKAIRIFAVYYDLKNAQDFLVEGNYTSDVSISVTGP